MEEKNMENNLTENEATVEPIEPVEAVENVENKKKFNIFSLIGLIFSVIGAVLGITYAVGVDKSIYVFLPCLILGVAFGIVGTVFSKKYRSGLGMGIAAIVIGALGLMAFAGFFILLVIIFTGIGRA